MNNFRTHRRILDLEDMPTAVSTTSIKRIKNTRTKTGRKYIPPVSVLICSTRNTAVTVVVVVVIAINNLLHILYLISHFSSLVFKMRIHVSDLDLKNCRPRPGARQPLRSPKFAHEWRRGRDLGGEQRLISEAKAKHQAKSRDNPGSCIYCHGTIYEALIFNCTGYSVCQGAIPSHILHPTRACAKSLEFMDLSH